MTKRNRSQRGDDKFFTKSPSFTPAELKRNPNWEDINRGCQFCDQKAKEAYNFEKRRYPHKFIKILNDLMYAFFCGADPAYLRYPDSTTWEELWKGFKMTLDTRYNLKHDRRRLAYVLQDSEYVQVDLCREGESYRLFSTQPDKVKKGTCSIDEQRDSDLPQKSSPLDEMVMQELNDQIRKEIARFHKVWQMIIKEYLMKPKSERPSQAELGKLLAAMRGRPEPFSQGFISQEIEHIKIALNKIYRKFNSSTITTTRNNQV